jgi:hypothetical protein
VMASSKFATGGNAYEILKPYASFSRSVSLRTAKVSGVDETRLCRDALDYVARQLPKNTAATT